MVQWRRLPARDAMPRVPRHIWVVSLAVAVILLMAVASTFAAKPVAAAQTITTNNKAIGPAVLQIGPRDLAGVAALVISTLMLLVFIYRPRQFIALWTAGWAVTGLSLVLAGREYGPAKLGWLVYGVSQFLGVIAALLFVISADAFRNHLRFRREYVLVLVPVLLWFALAPMLLEAAAVFAPGHLMIAGGLAAAGVAHLLLLRQVKMLGAAIAGVGLIVLAAVNAWIVISLPSPAADGATKLLIISAVVYLIVAGGMQLMTFEDITYELRHANHRLAESERELSQAVITDPLTGCRNRRFFEEVIGRELKRHRRYDIPLSLLFVDIDRFKAINDTYGHDVGDEVLKQVSAFLLRHIREADFVFRWGGDEFLALLSCSEAEARKRGAALETAFTHSPDVRAMPTEVRLSIGCAEIRDDDTDVMSLVRVADERMYENKRRAS
jgi:diguanylate cyclase (GGDEF)-like protein